MSFGTANRDTDTTYLKQGTLKRITYPAGGYTEFQYEPHRYKEVNTIKYAGGLRIKSITSTTGSSQIIKRYKYGGDESGNGLKNFNTDSYLFSSTRYFKIADGWSSLRYRSRMYFSNSMIGTGYEESPVVYPIVTEYEAGTNVNGKTVYEFDNKLHIPDIVVNYPFATSTKPFINSMGWARGKLTKKLIYNNSNLPLSETAIEYENFKADTIPIGQGVLRYIYQSGPFNAPYFEKCYASPSAFDALEYIVTTNQKSTGVYKEIKRTEKIFTPGNPDFIRTSNKYYHPEYLQLVKEETMTGLNPEVRVDIKRFPYDLVSISQNYTGQPGIFKQMVLKNILSTPVEEYSLTQNSNGTNQQIISGQVNLFKETVPGSGRYKPDKIYFLETASPLPGTSYSTVGLSGTSGLNMDARYKMRISLDTYHSNGNLLQFTHNNGQISSYLWAYGGAYPVASAINATSGQIAFTSFETGEKGGWTYSGLEKTMPYGTAKTGKSAYLLTNAPVTRTVSGASTGNPFKLSFWARSETGSVSWAFLGTTETLTTSWKLIERTITSTSLNISGTGIYIDELRIHPGAAQMKSYTYSPLMGIGTVMDERNNGQYFIYDFFGRLESVKNEDGNITEHFEYNYINN